MLSGEMSPVFLLLLASPLVSAQTFHWGPCSSPKVQPNFDVQQYLGKWYEIAKLPASFETGKCVEANYALRADGSIRILNVQSFEDITRPEATAEGTAVVEDPSEPAKLGVSFSYFVPYSPYWVLTTDYSTLAVVYSCTDILRIFHIDYAWILARARYLHPPKLHDAKQLLIKYNIDISGMRDTDQTGCKDD